MFDVVQALAGDQLHIRRPGAKYGYLQRDYEHSILQVDKEEVQMTPKQKQETEDAVKEVAEERADGNIALPQGEPAGH